MGKVMLRNFANPLAPSMAAASYRSTGMVCKPTKNIMKVKPRVAQTSIMTRPGIPQVEEPSQLGGLIPILAR